MIPEMPPQRHASPGFAPSNIIERAAQHLDWTVAFGMRHNTLRGLEETTSQQPRPDPPRIARASRLRSSRAGGVGSFILGIEFIDGIGASQTASSSAAA